MSKTLKQQQKQSRSISEIIVTLPQAVSILNFLSDELAVLKIIGAADEPCMAEIQIPPKFIGGELVFARVQINGDIISYSFHFYPDDVVAEVTAAN